MPVTRFMFVGSGGASYCVCFVLGVRPGHRGKSGEGKRGGGGEEGW